MSYCISISLAVVVSNQGTHCHIRTEYRLPQKTAPSIIMTDTSGQHILTVHTARALNTGLSAQMC